ncbi:MAG: leucyl aminopeptidase [Spirochaetes bacterium]|nr:leucyl aminopeptidase [Spirochaetota bacterium]
MAKAYEFELGRAAYVVVVEMCRVKKGETVLITIDSAMDFKIAEEIAKVAQAVGGKVMVAWHTTPSGYGAVAESYLPKTLNACIPESDVWIELNDQWLLYNSAWDKAMSNGKTRYLFLGGMAVERIVRCIARLDIDLQDKFQDKVVELTKKAKKMRITTTAGTDVSFDNADRPVTNELRADTPGAHFLVGQIGWAPLEKSINGKIVFDGSFSGGGKADLGILAHPVELIVKEGIVVEINGKGEATAIKNWLEGLNDPGMYKLAHVCYGFNPGAVLTGLCTEDERVWGSTEWGLGHQGPMFKGALKEPACSHADGICLNSTVWADDKMITENGKVVHPELIEMAKAMGKG